MKNLNKKKYDKLHETDVQMLTRIGKKFAIIIAFITLIDTLIDVLSSLLDMLLDLLHIAMEFIESWLEWLLEHLLNADHQQSDTIIVNAFLVCALYLLFRLIRNTPRIKRWIYRRVKATWLRYKHREKVYWHALPLSRKIKVSTTYLVGISSVLFLLTM